MSAWGRGGRRCWEEVPVQWSIEQRVECADSPAWWSRAWQPPRVWRSQQRAWRPQRGAQREAQQRGGASQEPTGRRAAIAQCATPTQTQHCAVHPIHSSWWGERNGLWGWGLIRVLMVRM
eukprot:2869564-Pyramimonas_sp.AAC.1